MPLDHDFEQQLERMHVFLDFSPYMIKILHESIAHAAGPPKG